MLARARRVFTFKKSIPRDEIQLKDVQMIQKFASVARGLNHPTAHAEQNEVSLCAGLISDIIRSAPSRPDYSHTKLVRISLQFNLYKFLFLSFFCDRFIHWYIRY